MSGVRAASAHTVTLQRRETLSDYVTGIAWSPDGQWLAAASAAGEVTVYQPPHGQIELRSPQGLSINGLAFATDSQFLAAAGQAGELIIWRIQPPTFPIIFQQSDLGAWIDQLAWRPRQNQLAVGVGPKVQLWCVKSGDHLAQLDFQTSSALHLAWCPAGRSLAVSGHGGMKVWDARHWRTPPAVIQVPGASIANAWSPDGRYLASGNLDRTLTVAEWGSPPPWLMQGFPGKVRQLSWSTSIETGDSPLLAAACADGVTVWEREERQDGGWTSRVLQHHCGVVDAIAFQPNSQLLASADREGQIVLWRHGEQLSQPLKGFSQGVSCLAWQPGGQRLAAGGTAGELSLWRVTPRTQGVGFHSRKL